MEENNLTPTEHTQVMNAVRAERQAKGCVICKSKDVEEIENCKLLKKMSYREIEAAFPKYNYKSINRHFVNCLSKKGIYTEATSKAYQLKKTKSRNIIKSKIENILKIIPEDLNEELFEIKLTSKQIELVNHLLETNQTKPDEDMSSVDKVKNLSNYAYTMAQQCMMADCSIQERSKALDIARSLLETNMKISSEISDVTKNQLFIKIVDDFTTLTAKCPACKDSVPEILKQIPKPTL